MKSFQAINYLKEKGIAFHYTPFDQGALVEILDPEWLGACNALAHEWILRKICVEDMQTPAIHEIKDPHLPHFIAYKENTLPHRELENILRKDYDIYCAGQYSLEKNSINETSPSFDQSIAALLEVIESQKFHYGVIKTKIIINGKIKGGLPEQFGHVVAFVKREDAISLFDPNYGEITFTTFAGFSTWFTAEAKNGALGFIFNAYMSKRKYATIAEVFPQPIFTEAQQKNPNPIAKKIIQRRTEAEKSRATVKEFIIADYTLNTFFSDTYIKPTRAPENNQQEEKAKYKMMLIKNSMLHSKSIFGNNASSTDSRNQLLWNLIRKAENNEIKYTEALKKMDKMHQFKIDTVKQQKNKL